MINFDEYLGGNYPSPAPCVWSIAAVRHYPAEEKIILLNGLNCPLGSNEDTLETRERASYFLRLTPDVIRYLFREYRSSQGEGPIHYTFTEVSNPHPILAGADARCESGELRREVLQKLCIHRSFEALEKDYAHGIDVWFERSAKRLLSPRAAYILAKIRNDCLAGITKFALENFLCEYQNSEFGRCWTINNTEYIYSILSNEVFSELGKFLGLRWLLFPGNETESALMTNIRVVGFDDL